MGRQEWRFRDCFAHFEAQTLTFGNADFSRSILLAENSFHTLSLQDGGGTLFACENRLPMDCVLFDTYADLPEVRSWQLESVSAAGKQDLLFDGDHLEVTAVMTEKNSRTRLTRVFFIYPGLAMFGEENRITLCVLPSGFVGARQTLRTEYGKDGSGCDLPVVDTLHPAAGLQVRKSVEFAGHTDVQDVPVREHDVRRLPEIVGNLLFCENDAHLGFLILQEAPPSSERREYQSSDFVLTPDGDLRSLGWGVTPGDLALEKEFVSYRNAVGVYHSGEEAQWLLKRYQKTRFSVGKRDSGIVANAWGCGKFPQLISRDFLKAEIQDAAACGADFYQIDDQWQNGSLRDLAVLNQAVELDEYWKISPDRLGEGSFEEFCTVAERCGIRLALWMAPSFSVGYRDWKAFAGLILAFYWKYRFQLFKIDGVCFSSYQAERDLTRLLQCVREASAGEVFFNLDVTAGMRGGFFMLLEYGTLFLENRYLFRGIGYHPERTLRSVWMLSRYTRLQNLQIEVPYIGDTDTEFYRKKHESDPGTYPWEYWLAIAVFGSPLLWFAPSLVPETYRKICRKMMDMHRAIRNELEKCEIFPVGDVPTGKSLTGFAAKGEDGAVKLLALFREKDAPESGYAVEGAWALLVGSAEITPGKIVLPTAPGFVICRKK